MFFLAIAGQARNDSNAVGANLRVRRLQTTRDFSLSLEMTDKHKQIITLHKAKRLRDKKPDKTQLYCVLSR